MVKSAIYSCRPFKHSIRPKSTPCPYKELSIKSKIGTISGEWFILATFSIDNHCDTFVILLLVLLCLCYEKLGAEVSSGDGNWKMLFSRLK